MPYVKLAQPTITPEMAAQFALPRERPPLHPDTQALAAHTTAVRLQSERRYNAAKAAGLAQKGAMRAETDDFVQRAWAAKATPPAVLTPDLPKSPPPPPQLLHDPPGPEQEGLATSLGISPSPKVASVEPTSSTGGACSQVLFGGPCAASAPPSHSLVDEAVYAHVALPPQVPGSQLTRDEGEGGFPSDASEQVLTAPCPSVGSENAPTFAAQVSAVGSDVAQLTSDIASPSPSAIGTPEVSVSHQGGEAEPSPAVAGAAVPEPLPAAAGGEDVFLPALVPEGSVRPPSGSLVEDAPEGNAPAAVGDAGGVPSAKGASSATSPSATLPAQPCPQQEPQPGDAISVGSSAAEHIPYGQYPVHGDLVDGCQAATMVH